MSDGCASKEDGMTLTRTLSIVAVASLAAIALAAAPSQAGARPSECSGTAENLTIRGDLAVPAGASCSLLGSTVTGNVEVRADATLSLDGSTVRGNLTVRSGGFVTTVGSRVGGRTNLQAALGGSFEGSELDGRVEITDSGFFFSDGTNHGSRVVSNRSQTVILSGRVDGDLRTNLDLLTDLRDTVVTGRLTVEAAEFGSVLCRSEIDGEATLASSGDVIQVGGGTAVADCDFNVFGAGLTIRDNLAVIEVNGNVIRGVLACTGNDPAPTGANNRVRGGATGQCAELAAPPAAASAVSPDSRITALRERIATQTAKASIAAGLAGPADL
jgi:hypothetical protein